MGLVNFSQQTPGQIYKKNRKHIPQILQIPQVIEMFGAHTLQTLEDE